MKLIRNNIMEGRNPVKLHEYVVYELLCRVRDYTGWQIINIRNMLGEEIRETH